MCDNVRCYGYLDTLKELVELVRGKLFEVRNKVLWTDLAVLIFVHNFHQALGLVLWVFFLEFGVSRHPVLQLFKFDEARLFETDNETSEPNTFGLPTRETRIHTRT